MSVQWNNDAWIDIGHGVEIVMQTDTLTGEQVGLIERHACESGVLTGGGVPFADRAIAAPGSPLWTVEQAEPLTLSPSIQCPRCPLHGWIREGRWHPA